MVIVLKIHCGIIILLTWCIDTLEACIVLSHYQEIYVPHKFACTYDIDYLWLLKVIPINRTQAQEIRL